jgi:hypothetical protein
MHNARLSPNGGRWARFKERPVVKS